MYKQNWEKIRILYMLFDSTLHSKKSVHVLYIRQVQGFILPNFMYVQICSKFVCN